MPELQKRILIFNVNWLGDVVFSTAAIRNIRNNFPGSNITCIVPVDCACVLEGSSHIQEVLVFDERSTHKGLWAKVCFIRALSRKKFDIAFLLHRSLTRALLCRLAGIKEIIGYNTKKRGFLLTKKITPMLPDACHRIDYYLHIITQAGLKVNDRYTEFFFGETDQRQAEGFILQQGIKKGNLLVGINAGGNWGPKRWPKENWAALADSLVKDFGATIIITGGKKDVALAEDIQRMMKERLIIAAGKFNLKEFGALCRRFELFISADTGPMHIANAVGTKNIIALFGPTSPAVTGPYPMDRVHILQKDIGCSIPCYVVDCVDNRCMKAISVEDVLEEIKQALHK